MFYKQQKIDTVLQKNNSFWPNMTEKKFSLILLGKVEMRPNCPEPSSSNFAKKSAIICVID